MNNDIQQFKFDFGRSWSTIPYKYHLNIERNVYILINVLSCLFINSTVKILQHVNIYYAVHFTLL